MTAPKPLSEEAFPVLWSESRANCRLLEALGCPKSVPWRLLAPHESQALRNHDQTLQRLAERGGLCPSEMVAIIEDRRWHCMTIEDAVAQLLTALSPPASDDDAKGGG